MDKIKCIVVDDDLAYNELIASYIQEHDRLELAGKFMEPAKALQFLMRNPVPLIFIDMKMPEMTGIDFLRSLSYQPYAIILSSFPDFAMEGYKVNALDYILKPFEEERFFAAVNKAVEQINAKTKAGATDALSTLIKTGEGYFFIQTNQQYIKVSYKDVLFIEGLENFVKIYTSDKDEPLVTHVNLKQLEGSLPPEVFLRTHKSYIVNMNHVSLLDVEGLKIKNRIIPVGPSYKEVVLEKVIANNLIRR